MIFSTLSALLSSASVIPPPPTDPWSLLQYGILAVGLGALLLRKGIVPEWVLTRDEEREVMRLIEPMSQPKILVINKTDLDKKPFLDF